MNQQDFQKLIDGFAESDRYARSRYHVTLGEMLSAVGQAGDGLVVFRTEDGREWGAGDAISYRGYYSDLAIEPESGATPTGDLMLTLMAVQDTELEGYKGGQYLMGSDTPVWLDGYGQCNSRAVVRWDIERVPGEKPLLVFYTKKVD